MRFIWIDHGRFWKSGKHNEVIEPQFHAGFLSYYLIVCCNIVETHNYIMRLSEINFEFTFRNRFFGKSTSEMKSSEHKANTILSQKFLKPIVLNYVLKFQGNTSEATIPTMFRFPDADSISFSCAITDCEGICGVNLNFQTCL